MKDIVIVVCLGVATLWAQEPERERPASVPARPDYDEEMNPAKRVDVLRGVSPKPPGYPAAPSFEPRTSRTVRTLVDQKQVSITSLAAPKEAASNLEKARKDLGRARQNQSKAPQELEEAVAAYGNFAEVWYLLGETRLTLGDFDHAREAFERAIVADPGYTDPYLALASMELKSRHLEEAIRFADRALERNPYMAEARLTRAVALYNLGKAEPAKQILRDLLDSGETIILPRVHEILGEVLASERDFRAAAAEYREFLKLQPASSTARRVRSELGLWKTAGLIE